MEEIRYQLSDAAMRRSYIESGHWPDRDQKLEIDVGSLTPQERETLLAWREVAGALVPSYFDATRLGAYQPPSADGWSRLDALQADHLLSVEEALHIIRSMIAQGTPLAEQAKAIRARLEAERAAAREAEQQAEAARQAEQQRQAAEFDAERRRWAAAHGSDHLRRAVEAGYSCTAMYLRERAAQEYPGFVVDAAGRAEWRSRSCPSPKALDLVDEVRALHGEHITSASVIWLTRWPCNTADPDEPTYDYEPCEAVVVRDRRYREYDLVFMF